MTWWSIASEAENVRWHLTDGHAQPDGAVVDAKHYDIPEIQEQQWAVRNGLA